MQHNYQEELCGLYDKYYETHDGEGATAKEVAVWPLKNGLFEVSSGDQVKIATKKFADAFRQEMITDPQGRVVRRKHAALISTVDERGKEKQVFEWSNIETMRYERVVPTAAHRRGGIRDDVESYRDDFGSYNENHLPRGKPSIQLSFNFDIDASDGVA